MGLLQSFQDRQDRSEPSPSSGDPWKGPCSILLRLAFSFEVQWCRHRFQASLQFLGPSRHGIEEGRSILDPQGPQTVHHLAPFRRAFVHKILGLDPGPVALDHAVHGTPFSPPLVLVAISLVDDRVGVKGLDLLQPPALAVGFKHAKQLLHKGLDWGFVEGQTHGHVDAVGLFRKGLKQGAQTASIWKDDEGLVEFFGRQFGQCVAHILRLADRGGTPNGLHLGRRFGQGGPWKCALAVSVFADEQPRFVVWVVHVTGISVPKDSERLPFLPPLKTAPLGFAHGGQTCGKHMVHLHLAFAFGNPSGQLCPGGESIVEQRPVQFVVQSGEPAPLAFKRLLVF